MADMDWTSWSKTKPLNIEALTIFNAADVDPSTALVGCAICQRFNFSSQGVQNIARAFGGLHGVSAHPSIALGYTSQHVVPLLLKSDDGSTFLAMCGALSEYYPLETVTAFFMLLAKDSGLPRTMQPAESQWTKLISICAGVLATSPFGTVITKYAENSQASISKAPAQILEWVLALNDRKTDTISGDTPILAAMADWLFGIRFSIQTEKDITGGAEIQTQLTLKATAAKLPTAGRVHWNNVFRTCFGQAWREMNKDTLTAVIACSSGIVHSSLLTSGKDPRTFFLRHEVGIGQLAGFGLNETIIAWFEELRRLAPGIPRYYKNTGGPDAVHQDFDKQMETLEAECKCSTCGDGSASICKASLAQVTVGLGLFCARMVVVPNLYLKVDGIQEFYQRLHDTRMKQKEAHGSYSEWFTKFLAESLPTPFRMLEVACTLFTGTLPGTMPENQVSLARSGLYIMITYLKFNPDDSPESRPAASVQVQNGGFCYHGRFLQKNFWDTGPENIPMEEGFENFRVKPNEFKQAVKLQDQVTLITMVGNNETSKAKAQELGWDTF